MKTVNAKKMDPAFKYEVAARPGAENLKKCFSCGTCTSGCPVFQVESEYNPRKIIRMILLGLKDEVLRSKTIWLCARCYACTANCPQEVNFADIMTVLRDMAVEAGYAKPDRWEKIEAIHRAAHTFRKDSINLLTGAGTVDKKQIRENIEKALNELL